MTEKQKKIATICTVTGVVLLLVSVIALVYNLISLAVLSGRRNELEKQSAQLQEMIEANMYEIEYKQTSDYIEKYARDYLNMKYEDEEVYAPQ